MIKKTNFYDIFRKDQNELSPLFKSKTPQHFIKSSDLSVVNNIPGMSRDASLMYIDFKENYETNK